MKTFHILTTALLITFATVVFAKEEKANPTGEEKAKAAYLNVVPGKGDTYKVLYTRKSSTPVEISIMTNDGRTLETDKVRSSKNFKKSYDFSKFPEGTYKFSITDDEGTAEREVIIDRSEVLARILPSSNHLSFKVLVPNTHSQSVSVKIFDNNYNLIKEDTIEGEDGFIKYYSLTKTLMNDYSTEVWMNGKVVAKNYFNK
ncbi:MAG: hypothetical protein AAF363_08885 [Bacteroidota bacterium]